MNCLIIFEIDEVQYSENVVCNDLSEPTKNRNSFILPSQVMLHCNHVYSTCVNNLRINQPCLVQWYRHPNFDHWIAKPLLVMFIPDYLPN